MRLLFMASLLFFLMISVPGQAEDFRTVEKHLTDQLKGQVVTLRQPIRGSELRFDREGRLLKGGEKGSWTLYSRVEVEKVSMKNETLRIQGVRLYVGFLDEKQEFAHFRTSDKVRIDIETGVKEASLFSAQMALARVFLTQDELASGYIFDRLIGYFWSGKDEPNANIAPQPANVEPGQPSEVHDIKSVMTPPQCESCPDPVYNTEARRFRHEGLVVLWCVVTAEGKVESLRIQKSLGMGLDEEAVKAVKQWRFKPAVRGGQPVAVHMAIEIHFHPDK